MLKGVPHSRVSARGPCRRARTQGRDVETFGVGAMYGAGPFGISLNYIYGEDDQGDVEQDAFELGAQYKLGPGVTAKASFFYVEQEDSGGDTVDGIGISGGIALSF